MSELKSMLESMIELWREASLTLSNGTTYNIEPSSSVCFHDKYVVLDGVKISYDDIETVGLGVI